MLMVKNKLLVSASGILILLILLSFSAPQWGFYGHRKINKMAVFTLPPEMMVFFKKNIEYLSEHAVDPDKRRYATKYEAIRHYIDIDHWGTFPFDNVPRKFNDALLKFSELQFINGKDTSLVPINKLFGWEETSFSAKEKRWMDKLEASQMDALRDTYKDIFINEVVSNYYEEEWLLSAESIEKLGEWFRIPKHDKVIVNDQFSEWGILPYQLVKMQKQITKAFTKNDTERLLRYLSDYGHYVGDAHVPLHTTENYNGQLTDQIGIHAFWESRIPELFADKDFDFFVGKAEYIDNVEDYVWDIVLSSHALLDSVLLIEKRMSQTYPNDQQYCFEERLDLTIKTQCKAYAAEYNRQMGGMVETRMRETVLALGSLWYTAWVDAGQPDLRLLMDGEEVAINKEEQEELEKQYRSGEAKGRGHGQ